MNVIVGKVKYDELELKRLYLHGLFVEYECPECSESLDLDMGENYTWGYKADGKCFLSACCDHCCEEVNIPMKLSINLEFDDE